VREREDALGVVVHVLQLLAAPPYEAQTEHLERLLHDCGRGKEVRQVLSLCARPVRAWDEPWTLKKPLSS